MNHGTPPSDLRIAQAIAAQYADDPTFKSEIDKTLGVFHLPPHKPGVCEGCDAARAKGQIKDADWKGRLRG